MKDTEIITALRAYAVNHTAAEVAAFLLQMHNGALAPFPFISYFAEAFPDIPFRLVIRLSAWQGRYKGGFSDEEVNTMLEQWIPLKPQP